MLPRNMAGQFVSGCELEDDESSDSKIPFGFHCVSRSEAEDLALCDWLNNDDGEDDDDYDMQDDDDIYPFDIILASTQDLSHEENRRVREAVAYTITLAKRFRITKSAPVSVSNQANDGQWEPGTSLHDVDNDKLYQTLPVEPEVVEIWKMGSVEVSENSHRYNRVGGYHSRYTALVDESGHVHFKPTSKMAQGQSRHGGNDTRRRRRGGKLLGGNHSRAHKAFVPARSLTHVRVDDRTFKVGRIS